MGGLNMSGRCIACEEKPAPPRVVVVGLASCFGCQLQITNAESHLLDVLGQIDLRYWQLASSDPMPEDFDVAVIEGAVTTEESENLVRALRARAAKLIAIGACATTAGIPGMASVGFLSRPVEVYGEGHVPCLLYTSLDRPDARTVAVIAMTANAFSQDVAESRAHGMDGHISKPLDVRTFYDTMNGFMKR